jgi:CRISPR-associated protein Csd1
MSWIEKLYKTYEACAGSSQFESEPPLPLSHTEQQAHIEIVLDAAGNFTRAVLLEDKGSRRTLIQASEESAGRTTNCAPHPLCDKIQYCAADYSAFGGEKKPFFNAYLKQFQEWAQSDSHPSVDAVLSYVKRGTVVADLVRHGLLHCSAEGKLLTRWESDNAPPAIFKMLTAKEGKRDQGDVFVRWRVQSPGDLVSAVWQKAEVQSSWIRFDAAMNTKTGFCMVSGEMGPLAASHPKRLRHGGDGAKLISSNDSSGFTFRGRFDRAEQCYGISVANTQKAHSALRWLIARQGYHDKESGQVFVSWALRGQRTPNPLASTAELLGLEVETDDGDLDTGDVGQHFARRLTKAISGYGSALADHDEIVVMGLDSASPGRMGITYYRELAAPEFLRRLQSWHTGFAWFQNYSAKSRFIGAPAPRDIAECAYTRKLDERLRKATVERLLPCIIDARPIPQDLVDCCVRRVSNRSSFKQKDQWEWEKCLGIACSLVRGSRGKEGYDMALEENRTTRDYLFGRLLAVAESIEGLALYVAKENRETNAAKLMHRFADRPSTTWKSIELALTPYKARVRASRPASLVKREKLLDEVMGLFRTDDFINDGKLSGEFLLGYHCQRASLWSKADIGTAAGAAAETENGGLE